MQELTPETITDAVLGKVPDVVPSAILEEKAAPAPAAS
jgi:hypothetical protein